MSLGSGGILRELEPWPQMPDFVPPSDDDETLEPWFNDTGDFGDNQEENCDDDE